jgi:hypothetical protein
VVEHAGDGADAHVCKLCNKNVSENEVKNKCKTDYGEEYEKCPIYKNR